MSSPCAQLFQKRGKIVRQLTADGYELSCARVHEAEFLCVQALAVLPQLGLFMAVDHIAQGTIDAPIGRHPADRKKMAVTEKNSRSAVTHWRVLERFSGYTLVECKLETGRTHQIRVHMAYRGHPILGDMVYGRKKPELGQDSQCLHAKELRFVHPRTGKPVTVSCELPDYFAALLEKLRSGYRRA